jgi:hypothetical protein
MQQFFDTLNPLQPSWQPWKLSSQMTPRVSPPDQPVVHQGIVKDGLYVSRGVHIHASDPTLNPRIDQRILTFDVIDFDTGGFAAGQAMIDRLIIPAGYGGIYLMLTHVDTGSSGNGAVQAIMVGINGATALAKDTAQVQGQLGAALNVTAIWYLDEGDFVQVTYQDSLPNAAAYLNVVEPGTPSLSMLRIGG